MLAGLSNLSMASIGLSVGPYALYRRNPALGGHTALLVMPQVQYEIGKYWMIQGGVGARFTHDFTLPEVGFRIIREF